MHWSTFILPPAVVASVVYAAVPYSQYILAPSQRKIVPVSVHQANGTVSNPAGLTASGNGTATFSTGSAVTFDYGKNIGGIVSFEVTATSDANQYIGISFTESSLWITPDGCDGTQNVGIDQSIWFQVTGPGNYSVDYSHGRGGFRYLNVYHNSTGNVTLSELSTNFTAMPHWADDSLGAYTGYFHTEDDKLNRVWYASAYTDQLCTIPSGSGNSLVNLDATNASIPTWWYANATLTNGTSALVDGAKRDKLIWPGDYGISVPGVFLSTNDAITIKLSLEQLYADQNATTGELPYVAAPIFPAATLSGTYSFTYHMYNILGLANYYIYSGDITYLQQNWNRVKLALSLSLSPIDSTGLAYVGTDATADWLRFGMGARNIEANSILYYTINQVIQLAYAVNDTSMISNWTAYAAGIQNGANTLLWNATAGFYTDNQTTTLNPQDGNSWAVISGVANTTQAATISTNLAARWGPYGAPAPEAGTTVSPFATGFELQAHFLAGQPQNSIDLMGLMWADFMLDDPRMTNSTFIEGYDVSGALHYPAYQDDARISHAHGWATAPIIALTNYAAGLHVINSTSWVIHPQPGNLSSIDAGFAIASGTFSSVYISSNDTADGAGSYMFSTPTATTGTMILDIPSCNAQISVQGGSYSWNSNVTAWTGNRATAIAWWGPQVGSMNGTGVVTLGGLPGGNYSVAVTCQ